MARKKTSKKAQLKRIVGRDETRPINEVQPNPWNPNRMTPFMLESLKRGLQTDGWLASQKLLVWGKDENGQVRDLIIDGEHRWRVARDIGFTEAPMVMLDGLTETEAKALTIKMNQKRGEFDAEELASLVNEIMPELDISDQTDLELELGFDEGFIGSIIEMDKGGEEADGPVVPPPAPPPPQFDGEVGAQPKMRLPLVFFVVKEDDQWLKQLFKHPSLETELNNELFLEMVEAYLQANPGKDPR